ncbi:TIGR03790 family protein [Methyloversatilis thermotolerans]|uniref:TIGR03790 family protein n=1 Tax=Methyloversatilis thermotolerans TaxID=1346290 RepID=UPI0003818365|nr:TIGR03790 family protein [Methyloversatilis thermotolerans]
MIRILCLLSLLLAIGHAHALGPAELAVIVNGADPDSVDIARYYRERRGIPEANVITVNFPHDRAALTRGEFEDLYRDVERRLPPGIQAFALAWTRPWRAGCMSITSAFAFGYDESFCSASCGPTRSSRFYNGGVHAPEDALMPRPAMLLAGESRQQVHQLIDRGLASDFTYPKGSVYLVRTEDAARNVRAVTFDQTVQIIKGLHFENVPAADAQGRQDVLGYFTGAVRVPGLDTLHFLPGAPADHLTSFGGQLLDNKSQMSALEWLKAGATASYGTVVEPCNHLGKFPNPALLMNAYANGETLIEAYWRSVAWPGEGVFIGEPLARPFGTRTVQEDGAWWVEAHTAAGRRAVLEVAPSIVGPYRAVGAAMLPPGYSRQKLPVRSAGAVRVR